MEGRAGSELRFFLDHMKFNLASAMEYRASFLSQIGFMVLNDAMLLFFWWVLFRRLAALNGWQFTDVMMVYAIGAAAFGVCVTIFGNAMNLSKMIAEGQIDYYLLLPRDPLIHILITRMDMSGPGDIIFGLGVFLIFMPLTLSNVLIYLVSVATATLIFTSFVVIANCTAFYLGHSQVLSQQLTEALLSFSLYPGSVFTGIARLILFTLIPAGFMVYIPVELLRAFSPCLLIALLAFTALITSSAVFMFKRGLRRYESGNLMVARM